MSDSEKPDKARAAKAKPAETAKNPSEVEIYPIRTYLDAGEIKRRAGPSYTAPRRHAEALIARGLASTEKPKA